MTENNSNEFINTNARDSQIKNIYFDIEKDLFSKEILNINHDQYICICSGSTTSSCAKDDFITLDLRKKYNQINFNKATEIVSVGGGVLMKDLLNQLELDDRIFPIGLSNLPGMGYVLTGGVSPLSRRYGLAIDNVEFIKGYLGNGKYFSLYKNNLNENEKNIWEALRGAAPFLAIITEIGLKTIKKYPILILEGFVNQTELEEIIEIAESFPKNMSLQWIFSDRIYITIVAEIKTEEDNINLEKYLKIFNKFNSITNKIHKSFNHVKFFPRELDLFEFNQNFHSEVMSLLGEDLNTNTKQFIQIISEINKNKPNKCCYVACQQLGGITKKNESDPSLFVHRNSSWKPWIFTAWERNNLEKREHAITWMNESWCKLKPLFPNIHLAQLHNHLKSHEEELIRSFDKKLHKLKFLKNFCDPSGILPPL